MSILVRYFFIVFLLITTCFCMSDAWRMLSASEISADVRRVAAITSIALGSVLSNVPQHSLAADDPGSFANQLKLVQAQQVQGQQQRYETLELEALNRELLWPGGRLIARGAALLMPQGVDPSAFPYGVSNLNALDPAFSTDEATLFILGVGRDDLTPIAAKTIPAKDLTFPLIFELETSDLIFPYTPDAWTASDKSKDSIAVTCILSPGRKLATAPIQNNVLNLVGFAVSEPVNIAGTFQRSTARVFINGRIDPSMYSKEELDILAKIDSSLATKQPEGADLNKNSKNGKLLATQKR